MYIPKLALVSEVTVLEAELLTAASSLLPHAVKDMRETLANIAIHNVINLPFIFISP